MNIIDVNNSNQVAIGITDGSFEGSYTDIQNYDNILILINTDIESTLYVEFSTNSCDIDLTKTCVIPSGGDCKSFSACGKYYKIRLVNNGGLVPNVITRIQSTLRSGNIESKQTNGYNGNIPIGYGVDIAAGRFDDVQNSFLGSHNASVGATNLIVSPLAPVNGLDISLPTVATRMEVISDSADDAFGGSGANVLFLGGLDENYEEISEVILMNGQTQVATTNFFLRTNILITIASGSGQTNLGNIYLSQFGSTYNGSQEPNEILYRTIDIGSGFSQTAVCTVPAGYSAQVHGITTTSDASPTKPARVIFQIYRPAPVNTTYDSIKLLITDGLSNFSAISSQTQGEKSDFIMRAQTTSGGSVELGVHLRHFIFKSSGNENINKIPII